MPRTFEEKLLAALKGFNYFLHTALAVALVVASIMVMWDFTDAVITAIRHNSITRGFLQALGTLFIVWTLSSLISAEIHYVQSGVFHLTVLIEVAIITLLRQLIVEPVQLAVNEEGGISEALVTHHMLVLAALLVVGVLHWLVSRPTR